MEASLLSQLDLTCAIVVTEQLTMKLQALWCRDVRLI